MIPPLGRRSMSSSRVIDTTTRRQLRKVQDGVEQGGTQLLREVESGVKPMALKKPS